MRHKFRVLSHLLATTVGFAGGSAGLNSFAQEQQPAGQSVSSNQAATIRTPLNKSDGLKNLEQSIFRPFEGFSPQGSLDGVMNSKPTQSAPTVPNKRAKELMDRRKNWVFMTPEEIVTGKTSEEMFGMQGAEKSDKDAKLLSPMERYLQRIYGDPKKDPNKRSANGKDKGFANSANPFASSDDLEAQDDSMGDLPASVRDAQGKVKKSEDNGLKNKSDAERKTSSFSSFFSDVFALERQKPSPEQEQMEKDRLEAYRRSLGLSATPTFGAKVSSMFKEENDPYRISMPSLMDSSPKPSSLTPTPGVALPYRSALSDPVSKTLSPPSLAPALPKMDDSKSLLPPQPTFAAPRRPF